MPKEGDQDAARDLSPQCFVLHACGPVLPALGSEEAMTLAPDNDHASYLLAAYGPTGSFGLYELSKALHLLFRAKLDVRPRDITQIERYWLSADFGFSGFMLLLHDGRRAYLYTWVEQVGDDGTRPSKAHIALKILPTDQRLPEFQTSVEPLGMEGQGQSTE